MKKCTKDTKYCPGGKGGSLLGSPFTLGKSIQFTKPKTLTSNRTSQATRDSYAPISTALNSTYEREMVARPLASTVHAIASTHKPWLSPPRPFSNLFGTLSKANSPSQCQATCKIRCDHSSGKGELTWSRYTDIGNQLSPMRPLPKGWLTNSAGSVSTQPNGGLPKRNAATFAAWGHLLFPTAAAKNPLHRERLLGSNSSDAAQYVHCDHGNQSQQAHAKEELKEECKQHTHEEVSHNSLSNLYTFDIFICAVKGCGQSE